MALGTSIRAAGAYVELFLRDSKFLSSLRSAEKRFINTMNRMGESATRLGLASSAIGTGLMGAFAYAIKGAADYEHQMQETYSITGEGGKAFKALEKNVEELGRTTIFSLNEVAAGTTTLARANMDTEQIMDTLASTLHMAAVGHMDVSEAASMTVSTMRQLKMPASETARAIDAITAASVMANQEIPDLAGGLKYVGPMAKKAGMDIETLAASLSILNDQNIKNEMAGTTMRGVITALTSPSKQAQEAIDKLGLSLTKTSQDGKRNFIGFTNAMNQLYEKIKDLGSYDQLQTLGDIFYQRQAAGVTVFTDPKDLKRLYLMTKYLKDATLTAKDLADLQMDTLLGDIKRFEAATQVIRKTIGESINVRPFMQSITDMINAADDWIRKNKEVVFYAAAAATAFTVASTSLLGFGLAVTTTSYLAGTFIGALGRITNIFLAFADIAKAPLTVMVGLGSVMQRLGGQVAGLAKYVWVIDGAFRKAASASISWAAQTGKSVLSAMGYMKAYIRQQAYIVKLVLNPGYLKAYFRQQAYIVQKTMSNIGSYIAGTFRDAYTLAAQIATNAYSKMLGGGVNLAAGISRAFNSVTRYMGTVWISAVQSIASVDWVRQFADVGRGFAAAFAVMPAEFNKAAKVFYGPVVQAVKDGINGMIVEFGKLKAAAYRAANSMKLAFLHFTGTFVKMGKQIMEVGRLAFWALKAAAIDAYVQIVSFKAGAVAVMFVEFAVRSVVQAFITLRAIAVSTFAIVMQSALMARLVGALAVAWTMVKNAVIAAKTAVVGFFTLSKLGIVFAGIIKAIAMAFGFLGTVVSTVFSTMISLVGGVIGFMGGLPLIVGAIGIAIWYFWDSIAKGVNNMVSTVGNFATETMNGVVASFKANWETISKDFMMLYQGVYDAISNNDWEAAFQIAMLGLQLLAIDTANFLAGIFGGNVNDIVGFFIDGIKTIGQMWDTAVNSWNKMINNLAWGIAAALEAIWIVPAGTADAILAEGEAILAKHGKEMAEWEAWAKEQKVKFEVDDQDLEAIRAELFYLTNTQAQKRKQREEKENLERKNAEKDQFDIPPATYGDAPELAALQEKAGGLSGAGKIAATTIGRAVGGLAPQSLAQRQLSELEKLNKSLELQNRIEKQLLEKARTQAEDGRKMAAYLLKASALATL